MRRKPVRCRRWFPAGELAMYAAILASLAIPVWGLEAVNSAPATPSATAKPCEPSLSPQIPSDPESCGSNVFERFDDFSWRSFIALNWPADPKKERGTPDGNSGLSNLAVPRVWETWKADYELFQPGGAKPSEWNSYEGLNPCQPQGWDIPATTPQKIIGHFSKFGGYNQALFGAAGPPLVAQNRTYSRYEVRVNRPEHDFIRGKELYLRKNLPTAEKPPLKFTDSSIEIKAAWRELKPAELPAALKRYYVVKARVVEANGCVEKPMALVGFHISHKTKGSPQWIWSSFEHVDNIPEPGSMPKPGLYSFNNGDPNQQMLIPATPPPPIGPGNPPKPNPDPMQVVRVKKIEQSTEKTNAAYKNKLQGTVWANYKLVMTQWPANPSQDNGNPFPPNSARTNLANSTMETYVQHVSCMTCHDVARKAKLDFVWILAMQAYPPKPHLLSTSTPQDQAIDELKRILSQSQNGQEKKP